MYEGYEKIEKVKKAYERILYYTKLKHVQSEIEELLAVKKKLLEGRELMIRKYEEI